MKRSNPTWAEFWLCMIALMIMPTLVFKACKPEKPDPPRPAPEAVQAPATLKLNVVEVVTQEPESLETLEDILRETVWLYQINKERYASVRSSSFAGTNREYDAVYVPMLLQLLQEIRIIRHGYPLDWGVMNVTEEGN